MTSQELIPGKCIEFNKRPYKQCGNKPYRGNLKCKRHNEAEQAELAPIKKTKIKIKPRVKVEETPSFDDEATQYEEPEEECISEETFIGEGINGEPPIHEHCPGIEYVGEAPEEDEELWDLEDEVEYKEHTNAIVNHNKQEHIEMVGEEFNPETDSRLPDDREYRLYDKMKACELKMLLHENREVCAYFLDDEDGFISDTSMTNQDKLEMIHRLLGKVDTNTSINMCKAMLLGLTNSIEAFSPEFGYNLKGFSDTIDKSVEIKQCLKRLAHKYNDTLSGIDPSLEFAAVIVSIGYSVSTQNTELPTRNVPNHQSQPIGKEPSNKASSSNNPFMQPFTPEE
jgi:hypothetical protein